MSSFHPQRPQDWQTFLDRDGPPSPAPTDNLDAATLERFVGYTLQLGPIPTDDTVAVQNAITAAQLRDRHAPLHGQHVVVVDGGPMAGKTYAALRCALTQTRAAREAPPPDPACLHPATWAYVEVTQHHGIASVAQSLAGAIGAIIESRDRTPKILAKIRALAPRVGLAGYIVDDSHGILGARTRDSTTLATALKALITSIPATAVIVGADLRAQGILLRQRRRTGAATQRRHLGHLRAVGHTRRNDRHRLGKARGEHARRPLAARRAPPVRPGPAARHARPGRRWTVPATLRSRTQPSASVRAVIVISMGLGPEAGRQPVHSSTG